MKESAFTQRQNKNRRCLPISLRTTKVTLGAQFPAEHESGNIEYKRKVIASSSRLQQLATQMQFRLGEGSGVCMYRIGVDDGGYCRGITEAELDASARNLYKCAKQINPHMKFMLEKIPLLASENDYGEANGDEV